MKKTIGYIFAVVVILCAGISGGFFFGYAYAPDGYTGETEITDTILLEIIDKLKNDHYTQPEDDTLYEGMLDGLIDSVDDPFTTYFDYEEYSSYQDSFTESYVGIGVTISTTDDYLIVDSVVKDGPADQAGMLPNDIIVTVDETSIIGYNFYDARDLIVGEENTIVHIGIMRTGYDEEIVLEITRAVIETPTVEMQIIERNGASIAYIEVSTFGDETAELFGNAIDDAEDADIDGMIVDLRNNGGGHLSSVYSMLREFLVYDVTPMFSTQYYDDGELIIDYYYGKQSSLKEYDVVTLVNGNSASASEVFASAMQEHGGYTLVGETTYGKGTMQTDQSITSTCDKNELGVLDCTEADTLHITIGKWLTSDGNWVHFDGGSDGITPDIEIEPSIYEQLYKVYLLDGEEIEYDTVDPRTEIIQKILITMGYDVRIDGYFDDATLSAIQDVQTTNGMVSSNVIDYQTMTFINDALDVYQDDLANDSQLTEALDYLSE